MKKIFTLLFCSAFAFTSCSDDGAVGPQGPPGEDGLLATVFDVEGDFTAANNYELTINFNNQGVEVFETDAVLVYLKVGEDGTAGGAPIDVFRMMPQTYFINGNQLQYNFDYTFFDILVFLDGTVDLATLDATFTQDQMFRVVIIPGGFAATSGVDLTNMEAVLNALDIQPGDVQKAIIQD
jgi:hypothetical protein